MIIALRELLGHRLLMVKLICGLMLLWFGGALIGTSFVRKYLVLSHPLLVAIQARQANDDHSLLAVHENKLDQMAHETQAGLDDRKEIHAAIATLTDRINVDEAQFKAVGMVFGVLFSIFSSISTVMVILEYRAKRRPH